MRRIERPGPSFAARDLCSMSAHTSRERAPLDIVRIGPAAKAARLDIDDPVDLTDIRGQTQAKRALMIAAAGGHSLLFIGVPGSGKSTLARRLPGLLPAAERGRVAGGRRNRLSERLGFRCPQFWPAAFQLASPHRFDYLFEQHQLNQATGT